jgi:hypothetical protein
LLIYEEQFFLQSAIYSSMATIYSDHKRNELSATEYPDTSGAHHEHPSRNRFLP